MQILDGKKIAQEIEDEIKISLEKQALNPLNTRKPKLCAILVGEDPASKIYINRKQKKCHEVGINSECITLSKETKEEQLLNLIDTLNLDQNVDGILVQLPLPNHINTQHILEKISPKKDVDGFHPFNVGKMLQGIPSTFLPCTPMGIHELLIRYDIPIEGKNVVILGRSNIVGKPMAAILMQKKENCSATVTLIHSASLEISSHTKQADIIIAAMGKPSFLKKEMVKKGCVIVDVGINRIDCSSSYKGYKLVGDVDFDEMHNHAGYITPVPGGVGPMTIAMLLKNTLKSYLEKDL